MKAASLVRIAGLALLVLIAAGSTIARDPAPAGQAAGQTKSPGDDISRAESLGSPKAPITIEIFGDFQCPNCRQFYSLITVKVIANYVTPGKVYLVHRDFPIHPYAAQAARWAAAAALAGKYATVEPLLYETQDTWGANGEIEKSLAAVFSPADMKKIRDIETSQSARIDAKVQSERAMGVSRGVMGTPTVFLTHKDETQKLPDGGVSYALLSQLLDYYLAH